MLLSTLPDLAGRTYDVRGVVFSQGSIVGLRPKTHISALIQDIAVQAHSMGADAIVDIKVMADHGVFIVIGTAVKLR